MAFMINGVGTPTVGGPKAPAEVRRDSVRWYKAMNAKADRAGMAGR